MPTTQIEDPQTAPPTSLPGTSPPKYEFFKVIQGYLTEAARLVDLPAYITTILSQPKNEIIVNFPVKMDDGSVRLFKGYRIQHNNLLGPFKGGIRYHKSVSLDDLKALAAMMTWKCALMNLPLGGGKGGIKFDPNEVSRDELQRITRRFFHALGGNIGPETDVPAPDVGTDGKVMAWAMDTYMNTVGQLFKQSVKGVVTGKPVASGGTLGREKATGQGLVHCITEWADDTGFQLGGSTMLVQGFGNVGAHAAVILSKLGASTIAVGDHTGYLYNPEGFNPHKLQEWVKRNRSIAGYSAGKVISREEFFKIKADIFIPAALENQVGIDEAQALNCRLVAEGANGPCTPEGEKILLERGIDILPDVLANSGGVTVSYYEWVQNKRSESWSLEEVDQRLEKAMKRAYREVVEMARQKKCSMRVAAYCVALMRISAVYGEREIFPDRRRPHVDCARAVHLSKLLSLALRHEPAVLGLALDAEGWAAVADVLAGLDAKGERVTADELREIVATNGKQRFGLSADGTRIRARQGHSIDVDLGLEPTAPPARLFHGTVAAALASIRAEGLRPGARRHVHLSVDVAQAEIVARRRRGPHAILEVRAAEMHAAGHAFFVSENGVWLTEHVPPELITFPSA